MLSAPAVPISIVDQPSKVFITFQTGLLTSVHGIIFTLVDAGPSDPLAGETLADWKEVWHNYLSATRPAFHEACEAPASWVKFFSLYDRSQLSVGHESLHVRVSEWSTR